MGNSESAIATPIVERSDWGMVMAVSSLFCTRLSLGGGRGKGTGCLTTRIGTAARLCWRWIFEYFYKEERQGGARGIIASEQIAAMDNGGGPH